MSSAAEAFDSPTVSRGGAISAQFLDYLENRKLLDKMSLQRVRTAHATSGQGVDTILLELGLMPEELLADVQAAFLGLERVRANDFPQELPPESQVPREYLRSSGLLPIEISDDAVYVATARPLEQDLIKGLGFFLGRRVFARVATASELTGHVSKLLATENAAASNSSGDDDGMAHEEDVERLKDVAREAPTIKLLNRIITTAVEQNASDIHIEPMEDQVRVRFRVDGALQTVETLAKQVQPGLTSRVKILARLNIAEQRLPQDGRIRVPVRGREIDLRVSTTPILYGESIALRILDRQELPLDFEALGFAGTDAEKLLRMASTPNGIILVTGPTGSGKTTTLYAALNAINKPELKLFTVEDPVEYHLKGINQIHVKPQIGLDFAATLRSILRQDPDIIMVGEIRDLETARIAVQASLTGHLVLSTLHTNSAAASVTRLVDMGVEDYLLASCLRGIVAQRLLRRLCPDCKKPVKSGNPAVRRLGLGSSAKVFEACGCASCKGTGYKGRTVVYEIMEFTPAVCQGLLSRVSDAELEKIAIKSGMSPLFETAKRKIERGETSIEEAYRVLAAPVET